MHASKSYPGSMQLLLATGEQLTTVRRIVLHCVWAAPLLEKCWVWLELCVQWAAVRLLKPTRHTFWSNSE
jgi:hypothetical protein